MVSPVFVGRTVERAAIHAAWAQARAGRPVTMLVTGEAGIGKSRLVEAAVAELPGAPAVVSGGCLELGDDGASYVPFVAVLRGLLRVAGPDEVARLLPAGGSALAALVPDLPAGGAGPDRTRILEEMRGLVAGVARRWPMVLLVEDLHWADHASRELFGYLARTLDDVPVLLAATVRTGAWGSGHPGRVLVAEWGRRNDVARVPVGPLSRADVTALVTALTGQAPEPQAARRIHARSGGNPLHVEVLAEGGDAAATLQAALLQRVAALPGDAPRVLGALAVAGGPVPDDVLAAVAGPGIDDALRALLDRDQIVRDGDDWAVRHALLREAAYAALLPGERRDLHGRYGEAVADDAERSRHFAAAGEHRRALACAWRAAGGAAPEARTALLARVLDLWERLPDAAELAGEGRAAVHERAAAAAHAAGDSAGGIAHCSAALGLLDTAAEPGRAARLHALRGRLQRRLDGTGREDLVTALALVPDGDGRTRAEVLAALAFTGLSDGHVDEAAAAATEALALAEREGDDGLRAPALLVVAATTTDLARCRDLFAACRAAATASGDDETLLTGFQWEATALVAAGRLTDAADLAATGAALAERRGFGRSRGSMLAETRAAALVGLGRWDEACTVAEDALADDPPPYYGVLLQIWLAHVALHRGDRDRADRLIDRLAAYAQGHPDAAQPTAAIADLRARRELARGRPDQARRIVMDALAVAAPARTLVVEHLSLAITGAVVLASARPTRSRDGAAAPDALADRLAAVVAAYPIAEPGPAALAATFRARTADPTIAGWDAAAEAWRRVADPHALADALTEGAAAALATSNRRGAQRRLREARELARGLAAGPLLERIDVLAVRARLDDAAPAVRDEHGLTGRERDVLKELATGRTNAEIATVLFVSPNTVATHVGRILTKLGVASRTEAAALALRRGLA